MNCAVHPEVEASGYCRNCGKAMCPACVRAVRDVLYCEDCLAKRVGTDVPALPPGPVTGVPGPSTGSPALAFILGLIPGLGAIYNGEYNKALIHIVVFAAIVVGLSSNMGDGPTVALAFVLVGFIFYMAVDAMRTVKVRNAGEAMPDPLESWSKTRPVGPLILIAVGALLLLYNFGFFDFFRVRQIFWPLVLIGVGVLMLRNRLGVRN